MIEISVKGRWVKVPALHFDGGTIVITGKWIKLAAIHDEDWLESELENPELCVQALKGYRRSGQRADIYTFTQKVPEQPPKYGYRKEWDSVAAIRLTDFQSWWKGLPQQTRSNVRRSAKRGVHVRAKEFDDELVKELVVLNNSSAIRQGKPYTHYGKTFDQVKKDYSSFSDRSDFLCAYLENEMIGFLKIVYKGKVASTMNLYTKESHRDKKVANALIAKAVERCEARGVSYLTFGLFNYGNKRNTPLRYFKVQNGFQEMFVPRFYVPLTAWGALCLKLRLHRGVLGVLPHSILVTGIAVRAIWYGVWTWFVSRLKGTAANRSRQVECSNPPASSHP